MTRLGRLIRYLAGKQRLEQDLEDELEAYLAMIEDEAIAEGATAEEARRTARLRLGGRQQVKEQVRAVRVGARLESLGRDVRIGLRSLRKHRFVAAVAIVTLGLTIGANTAIFSVVDAVLLRPLPFREPNQLVRLWSSFPELDNDFGSSSLLDVEDWRRQSSSFESLAAYPSLSTGGYVYAGGDVPEEIETSFVTVDFFSTFGVRAALGRTFTPDEHIEGNDRVVVLSHRNWRSRFRGRADIVGTQLTLSGEPFTIIGVMPRGFDFPLPESELWAPLSLIPEDAVPRERYIRWLNVVGRLKASVSVHEAETELGAIARRLEEAYPDTNEALTRVTVRPLHDTMVKSSRTAILTVFGAVGAVLLVGCANIASLLLAQSEGRAQEFAVRSALGARRGRLLRQAFVESATLAVLGAGLGLILGSWGVRFLRAIAPDDIPRLAEVGVNGNVLGFTAALAGATSLLVGALPALRASEPRYREAMKQSARGSVGGGRGNARALLLIAQMSLVVLLGIGATLLVKSYARLLHENPGIHPENLLTLSISAQSYKYPETADIVSFFDRVIDSAARVPGVDSVAIVRPLPLRADTFSGENFAFDLMGRPERPAAERPRAALRFVSPEYFRTMGVPLLAGRDFDARDVRGAPTVLVANRTAAETYWPGTDPLGQIIAVGPARATIIGVVGDVRQTGLDETPRPAMYSTYRQTTRVGMTLVLRTRGTPLSAAADVKRAVWDVDPDQPIRDVATMSSVLSTSMSERRFSMGLLCAFALLALLLAAIGVYGVVGYTVTRRAREFGLRMALGARRTQILVSVVRHGMFISGVGITLGLAGAVIATRSLESLLYEVTARDPAVFAGVALLLAIVALVATLLPARAATRVEPVQALRHVF